MIPPPAPTWLGGLLSGAAALVLVTVAVGLLRVVRGPCPSDRMMGAQLVGTGGIALLLLVGSAAGSRAAIDVALLLALLAPFATVAFARGSERVARSDDA